MLSLHITAHRIRGLGVYDLHILIKYILLQRILCGITLLQHEC